MAKEKIRRSLMDNTLNNLQNQKTEMLSQDKQEILLIEISSINELTMDNNKIMHNRISYSQDKLLELAQNIKEVAEQGGGIFKTGIVHPVMLRRKKGQLERIHGDNRIKAIKLNGDKLVPAMIFENVSDELARFMRSSENLSRDDLNPYDLVLSVLEHIQLACGFDNIESVKSFINKVKNQKAGKSTFSEEEKQLHIKVSEVFEKIPKMDIISFVDRLSVLNMNTLIKQALVDGYLGYTQAVLINKKLKDTNKIEKILLVLKSKKLSVMELKSYISNMHENNKNTIVTPFNDLKQMNQELTLTAKVYNNLSSEKQERVKILTLKIKELYHDINLI